eukprot:5817370-Amphidinium_carterae.1
MKRVSMTGHVSSAEKSSGCGSRHTDRKKLVAHAGPHPHRWCQERSLQASSSQRARTHTKRSSCICLGNGACGW